MGSTPTTRPTTTTPSATCAPRSTPTTPSTSPSWPPTRAVTSRSPTCRAPTRSLTAPWTAMPSVSSLSSPTAPPAAPSTSTRSRAWTLMPVTYPPGRLPPAEPPQRPDQLLRPVHCRHDDGRLFGLVPLRLGCGRRLLCRGRRPLRLSVEETPSGIFFPSPC